MVFLISDGVRPSNKEAGYVLRRLMRRAIVYEFLTGDSEANIEPVLEAIISNYKFFYPQLKEETIIPVFQEENSRFLETVQVGLRELNKISAIDAKMAFKFYESFGLPYEIIKELGGMKAINLNREDFEKEFKKHQEISRAGLGKKFGGHGLKESGEIIGVSEDEKQKITKLHTATHLLHQALGDLFGNQIRQMGSDINPERFRFDFPFERKLTAEEIVKIENIVNQKIKESLPVKFEEKSKDEAIAEGAKAFFKVKYPEKVKVYSIGDYSKEICNGPHVKNTSEIGRFKILKEKSVGAGLRRIHATVE
jgi:alanyl-tRNA synthetase